MEKTAKTRIRRRHDVPNGSLTRPYMARIRMTRTVSKELASIQGLCYAFGRRETLAELFERVALPAIRRHVGVYARRAREACA